MGKELAHLKKWCQLKPNSAFKVLLKKGVIINSTINMSSNLENSP